MGYRDKLTEAIENYYGDPETNHYPKITRIIKEKLAKLSEASEWTNLVDQLTRHFGEVDNLNFLQLPNLMLTMPLNEEQTGAYRVIKKFTICLSLLCPYYTYYFDYRFISIQKMTAFMLGPESVFAQPTIL